jgi:hypothetical protein
VGHSLFSAFSSCLTLPTTPYFLERPSSSLLLPITLCSLQRTLERFRYPFTSFTCPAHSLRSPQAAALLVAEGCVLTLGSIHLGMSYSYYILLYTAIYDFCTQNRPSASAFGGGRGTGANLQGAELYRSLHNYFSDHCKDLKEVCGFRDQISSG